MSNSGVGVSSKQARVHDLGPIPSNRRDMWGWPTIKDFLSNVTFHVLNLCPILVSTFSRNRRDFMTNSIECRGPVRVANHKGFSFYRYLSCWEFMSNSGVNVFSKQARFHDLGQIPSNRGDLQGWSIIKGFFLSLISMLEIYVKFWCQRFLETGEISWPIPLNAGDL